jgi:hypothetical protein
MKFTVTSGNPTPEELLALEAVLKLKKLTELMSVTKRDDFGLPQLRQPLPHKIAYGARKFD